MGADLQQILRRQDADALNQGGFGGALQRQNKGSCGLLPRSGLAVDCGAHGKRAAYGPQLARERQFAGEFICVKVWRLDLPGGDQDAQRNGQVEAARLLGQVGRRQVYGDTPLRKIEATVLDCGTDPVTRFLYLGIGQANQGERWQSCREMNLNRDFGSLKACQCPRAQNGERHRAFYGRATSG